MKKTTLLKWCDGCFTVCCMVFLVQWLSLSDWLDSLFLLLCCSLIVSLIISLIIWILSEIDDDFKNKIDMADLENPALIRGFACLFLLMALLNMWYGVFCVVIAGIIALAGAIVYLLLEKSEIFFISSMTVLCICTVVCLFMPYSKTANRYEFPSSLHWKLGKEFNQLYDLRSVLAHLQFSKDEADEIMKNPFNISSAAEVILQKTKEIKTFDQTIKEQRDSISGVILSGKQPEYEQTMKRFSGKEEKLKIKRLWINSDVLPWTYEAYTSISFQYRHRHSLFSSSGSADLRINGNADYQGDNKLDYVNVILSDNTYLRYQVKDNPEWLLAKEGDNVLRRYKDKNFKLNESIIEKLAPDMADLCFGKEYVLQLKN